MFQVLMAYVPTLRAITGVLCKPIDFTSYIPPTVTLKVERSRLETSSKDFRNSNLNSFHPRGTKLKALLQDPRLSSFTLCTSLSLRPSRCQLTGVKYDYSRSRFLAITHTDHHSETVH